MTFSSCSYLRVLRLHASGERHLVDIEVLTGDEGGLLDVIDSKMEDRRRHLDLFYNHFRRQIIHLDCFVK